MCVQLLTATKKQDQVQSCKRCGQKDGFSFYVPDEIWNAVVPKYYQNKVLCLKCFDEFAAKKNINYGKDLQLWFAGEKEGLEFQVKT